MQIILSNLQCGAIKAWRVDAPRGDGEPHKSPSWYVCGITAVIRGSSHFISHNNGPFHPFSDKALLIYLSIFHCAGCCISKGKEDGGWSIVGDTVTAAGVPEAHKWNKYINPVNYWVACIWRVCKRVCVRLPHTLSGLARGLSPCRCVARQMKTQQQTLNQLWQRLLQTVCIASPLTVWTGQLFPAFELPSSIHPLILPHPPLFCFVHLHQFNLHAAEQHGKSCSATKKVEQSAAGRTPPHKRS